MLADAPRAVLLTPRQLFTIDADESETVSRCLRCCCGVVVSNHSSKFRC